MAAQGDAGGDGGGARLAAAGEQAADQVPDAAPAPPLPGEPRLGDDPRRAPDPRAAKESGQDKSCPWTLVLADRLELVTDAVARLDEAVSRERPVELLAQL